MRNLRSKLASSFVAVAVAALGLALAPSTAGADPITFIVDESQVPGANDIVLGVTLGTTAPNNITAKYAETLVLSGNTFTATLLVTFTAYAVDGSPVVHQIGANTAEAEALFPNQYGLYALVTVSGTFTTAPHATDPFITVFDFDPLTSTASIYVNPDQTGGNTGAGDLLVMTASLIDAPSSDGTVDVFAPGHPTGTPGTVRDGDFSIVYTNATTTGFGELYWPTFTGLVLRATSTGDVDPPGTIGPAGGSVAGDASLSFEGQRVPEPASLTLFGLALLGGGIAARRRRKD